MRIGPLAVAALLLAACSTGGASGGNRPYAAASSTANSSAGTSSPRKGRGGYDAEDVSLAAAIAGGRSAGRPVALYLVSAGCGWCRKLESDTLPAPAVKAEMASYYNVRISAESAAGREITGHYNIHAFPTVLFPDASGGKRTRDIAGYSEPVNFSSRLRNAR